MSAAALLQAQAYNNAWANHRLLNACAGLSPADLAAPRTSFFPSIVHTLNHILTVDWYYVSSLEGQSLGPAAFDPEIPYTDLADIGREQRAVDRRLITLCSALADADLGAIAEMDRGRHIQRERVDRTLLHLFEHQIHHRGQVHAMLSGTPVAPPQLDEFFPDSDPARPQRDADLKAIGIDPAEIWR